MATIHPLSVELAKTLGFRESDRLVSERSTFFGNLRCLPNFRKSASAHFPRLDPAGVGSEQRKKNLSTVKEIKLSTKTLRGDELEEAMGGAPQIAF